MSTKMSGFTMEVNNSDPNMVICGIRVLLGSQDAGRTPSYIEVICSYEDHNLNGLFGLFFYIFFMP